MFNVYLKSTYIASQKDLIEMNKQWILPDEKVKVWISIRLQKQGLEN